MKKNTPQVETPNTPEQPSQEALKVSTRIKCGHRNHLYDLK